MLKYETIPGNSNGVALNGATIPTSALIYSDNPTLDTPVQFGVDGVYQGKETNASGDQLWFVPGDLAPLGGVVNAQLANSLSQGAHTLTIKDKLGAVVETATFTVRGA